LKTGLIVTNLANAAGGLLLAVSPWLASFTHDAMASDNAVLCGLIILLFTVAALLQLRSWRSWMNLMPGIWVLFSPWILGFATQQVAAAIHVFVGLIVSILSLIELCTAETLFIDD
jgi:hypothetical protein